MTLIHAPKVTKIICPPLPGHIIHPPFHNGSKTHVSVPLRKPLSPCTLSTAPVRHLPSVPPFHNGSKTHDSVPLRRPLSPCTLSTAPVRHLPSASPFHNGSKIHDSVPLRKPPSICNGCYFAKQQKLKALCRSRELQIEGGRGGTPHCLFCRDGRMCLLYWHLCASLQNRLSRENSRWIIYPVLQHTQKRIPRNSFIPISSVCNC